MRPSARVVSCRASWAAMAGVLALALTACPKKQDSGGGETNPPDPASPSNGTDPKADTAEGGAAPQSTRKDRTRDGDGGTSPSAFVINKPTPEPMAPPSLRKLPSMPIFPNLPSPSKYPKATGIPKTADIEECGSVWSGEEFVPVECIDPSPHGKDARAAHVVIPYDKLRAPVEAMPKMVDHRADGTEGPIRKQGGPQCTAFALTAALDHAYARWTGVPGNFSVMQVWARYHQTNEHPAADNNVGDFLASETDWPYDAKVANSWLRCGKSPKQGTQCGKAVDDDKLRSLDKASVAELTQIEVVPLTQLDVLREKIAGGQDVAVAIKLPSFATAGEPGSRYVVGIPKDKPAATPKGGHEVALAGYAMTPTGTYYLVHNSWGPKWGDDGYAWLHEDFLKAYWIDKSMVIPDVQPMQVAKLRARAHGHAIERCGEGKAPDSISGLCAAKCPDGSPRHNNVCAKPARDDKDRSADCPIGMVNLTGECVLAAPKSEGTDPASRVRWECAPGGCAYQIPRDKLDCRFDTCEVSCPAPVFRLATTQKGLVCVE